MSSSANSPVNSVPFPFIAVGDLFTTGLADDQRTAWLSDHLKLQLSVGRTTFFVVPACHELVLDGSINIFKLSMH